MIGIIFATYAEASPLLQRTSSRKISERPFILFHIIRPGDREYSVVAISGMGKVAAALATQMLILKHQVDTVINAGVCGSVAENIEAGMILRITRAWEGDRGESHGTAESFPCSGELWKNLREASLVTSDKPVFDDLKKSKLAPWAELVDMEGAAVARTAEMYRVPCYLIKGVTDDADEGGREVLHKNLERISRQIAEVLLDGLRVA